jgi:DNA/RNA endonuclease G (NUC1)
MTERFKRTKWDLLDRVAINLLKDNPDSRIYMVSGVLYDQTNERFKRGRMVDFVERKVSIPDGYFRLFYIEESKRMYAVMIPRKDSGRNLKDYVLPVDEVERMSGYNFFSWVDNPTEIQQERKVGYLKPYIPKRSSSDTQVDLGKALLSIFE